MSDTGDDNGGRPSADEHRTPRWVKITGIIALVLVLLLITVLAFGGGPGEHGPGRHGGSDGTQHGGNHTAPEGGSQHGGSHNGSSERRGPVTWTVEVQDDAFAPATLTIQAGDTVSWTHAGENPHTVTADDGSFDSHPDCSTLVDGALGNCMSGGTYNRTFENPGGVTYRCKLHGDNGMEANIEVRQTYNETPGGRHH